MKRVKVWVIMSVKTGTKLVLGRSISLSSSAGDTYLNGLLGTAGLPEHNIVNLIAAACGPDSTMLDVGANIGYISIAMSLISPKGKIYAFEPAPKIFSFLKANVKGNGLKNVIVHDMGLSDKEHKTTISYPEEFPAGAFVSERLDMRNVKNGGQEHAWRNVVNEDIRLEALDGIYKKLGISKCDLLKVDIEGHEPSFISGAKNFISKFKPTMIMEVNHWCLNVFNRTSLPDFIDQVYEHFPYVFAFDDDRYLDLSDPESLYAFYYDNVVNNKFQNLFCGFDRNQLLRNLNSVFDRRLLQLQHRNEELAQSNSELIEKNTQLAELYDGIESSKSHRAAKKVNRVLRR